MGDGVYKGNGYISLHGLSINLHEGGHITNFEKVIELSTSDVKRMFDDIKIFPESIPLEESDSNEIYIAATVNVFGDTWNIRCVILFREYS